ncbi:hypothetical protein SASPL_138852 [Salvia splendens]|uniref:Uncharacterized protein n=1 Tax=Salvia splendens TaxID=180675 RepID=A0A8X8ZFF8_SALSN|nr:hypothetical protein SASPL_138852 [Salvia splendens]
MDASLQGQVIHVAFAKDLKIKLNAAAKMSLLAIVYFTATWSARAAAAEWQIASIPSFYPWKDGRVVDEEIQMRMNSLDKMILEHTA